jgi:exosortase
MKLFGRHVAFATICAGLMLSNWTLLVALYEHSRASDTASHTVLIPFVTGALVFLNRKSVFALVRTNWWGGGVVAAGLALRLTADAVAITPSGSALTVGTWGLAVCSIGAFVLVYGQQSFRAALFPLLFLGFLAPIPPGVLSGVTWFLRAGSTYAVAAMLSLSGTPYLREGFQFDLPTLAIEIADACSGIRSSIALLLTGLLMGYVFLDKSWKMAVLAVASIPFAILKNGIRITTLSLLSIHVDRDFLSGQLHHEGGVLFFLVGVCCLTVVAWFLRPARAGRTVGRDEGLRLA